MKLRQRLRGVLVTLVLALSLASDGKIALAQMACLDDCLDALAKCTSSSGGSQECEDRFDECLEACLPILG